MKLVAPSKNANLKKFTEENLKMSKENKKNWQHATKDKLISFHDDELKRSAFINCVVCADGKLPSDAHKCIFCEKAVHVIEGCSYPLSDAEDDEGYGQQRICKSCFEVRENMKAERAVENWRGLALPVKKRKFTSYLEPNQDLINVDFSIRNRNRPIGLLRNGNTNLKPDNL